MLNKQDILQQLTSAQTPKVLVIGDIMLDHYIHGTANRLSPEAPVPIVNVKNERYVLGGAANVALNLKALGAEVNLIGLIGSDEAGAHIKTLAQKHLIQFNQILELNDRPTTLKSRVIVGTHQMLRFDREVTNVIDDAFASTLFDQISPDLQTADIILISDYGKGLLSPYFTQKLIQKATEQGKKILVDPKGIPYEKYRGAFVIKPNRKELQEVTGVPSLDTLDEVKAASRSLLHETNSQYIITTLSENGIALTDRSHFVHFPVKATEVYDVTGAGDTVLAALSYAISIGLTIETACEIANYAAAIVVKHIGSAHVTMEEILNSLEV